VKRPNRPRSARRVAEPPSSSLISFSEPPPLGDDHVVRVVFYDRPDWPPRPVRVEPYKPRRWGYYPSHTIADDEVPSDVEYRYNTVEAATTGALQYLKPYWDDGSDALVIHNGVRVSNMPANAVITGSPGYRARIDAGLYDMGLGNFRRSICKASASSKPRPNRSLSITRFRSVSWYTPSA